MISKVQLFVLLIVELVRNNMLHVVSSYLVDRQKTTTIRFENIREVRIEVNDEGKTVKMTVLYADGKRVTYTIKIDSFIDYIAQLCAIRYLPENICKFCAQVHQHAT